MKPVLLGLSLCISIAAQAQNVGIGTSSPNANAKLDITATDKGVLIPRMDSVHRKSIPNTIGLLVYDSTTQSFWYNNGTAWLNVSTSASGWSLTGNSGLDTSLNFLGTTDNTPLIFRVNNQFAGKLGDGAVSIGEGAYLNNKNPTNMILTAVGIGTLQKNTNDPGIYTSGYNNTAVGGYALAVNTTGQSNTAMGAFSLNLSTTANNNTAMGAYSLQHNTTGAGNAAFGSAAVLGNRTGTNNTGLGTLALPENGSGNNNTAVGYRSSGNSDASGNTAIGANSLFHNLSGDNNTGLGYNSDFLFSATTYNLTNATVIGANAIVDASNKIRLGDANVTVVESNGVFNTVSDGRFKYNIHEDVKGLDFIMNLRPVTYQFDAKKQEDFTKGILSKEQLNTPVIPAAFNETNSIKRTGFIAQEVAAAAQKLGYDFDGVKIPASDKQYYSLSYASFVVPLVKAIQEQQQSIKELEKKNELLQQQNELVQQQNELVQQQNAAILKRLAALENKK